MIGVYRNRLIGVSLLLAMLAMLVGCTERITLEGVLKDARPVTVIGCDVFQPIALDDVTAAVTPRETKIKIAGHNKKWACMCDPKLIKSDECIGD